jgi:threonine synthase
VACGCGGLLAVDHQIAGTTAAQLRFQFDARRVRRGVDSSGVWRYRELVMPVDAGQIVSWPEGDTPLLERPAVARWAGASSLMLKHEGMNPTGSFKDRGMTVAVTHARAVQAENRCTSFCSAEARKTACRELLITA